MTLFIPRRSNTARGTLYRHSPMLANVDPNQYRVRFSFYIGKVFLTQVIVYRLLKTSAVLWGRCRRMVLSMPLLYVSVFPRGPTS